MKIINSSVKNDINYQIVNIFKLFINKKILSIPQLLSTSLWKDFLFLYKKNYQLQIKELNMDYKNIYNNNLQINEINNFLFNNNKIPQITIHRNIINTFAFTEIYNNGENDNNTIFISIIFD